MVLAALKQQREAAQSAQAVQIASNAGGNPSSNS
jgi:hypothetical protein